MYTLDKYVGNNHIKEELRDEIGAARKRNVRLANILITGPSGAGKTQLIRTIAHEIELPMIDLNSPLVKNIFRDILDQLPVENYDRTTMLFGKSIVFFDESHELMESIQQMMLKVQLDKRIYVEGMWYELENVTWAYATTDPDRMLPQLRNRCELRYQLNRYTVMEMAQILTYLVLEDQGKIIEITIPAELAHYVAARSRFIPRIGQQYMERIYNIARNMVDSIDQIQDVLDVSIAEQFFKRRKVTAQGLLPIDFQYLRCLDESRKAMGVKTIAAQLDTNDGEIIKTVEPFLRYLNLVNYTRAGREITPLGRQVLAKYDQAEYTKEQLDDLVLT